MSFPTPIPKILLVEDSQVDIMIVTEVLQDLAIECDLVTASNVEDALEELLVAEGASDAANLSQRLPTLILVDINLQGSSGLHLVRELKQDATFRSIPVVVLTTSQAPSDVKAAYDLQANCYLRKPIDYAQFRDLIAMIAAFWLQHAELPA
ncbi:MAG: response regulator [Gammaproteobacteria bacterium]|nr:response regulator [Gammaproteobacteria bacterium]MCP5146468.1 response regulator [Gammaproteobacteria bacterium]